MTWHRWYRIRSFARSSLWLVPFIAIVCEQIMVRALHWLDAKLGWSFYELSPAAANTMLQAVISMTLTFIVFTFGSLLVAIQIAGAQLTPRVIATTLLRDNGVKLCVGLFVFTLLFAVGTASRLDTEVRQLPQFFAALLGLTCLAAFLYLIDYAARLLRPVSIVARVGDSGVAVIEGLYPQHAHDDLPAPHVGLEALGSPARVLRHQGRSEIVLAVNLATVRAEAERLDGVIEFVPQVGDFVAVGEPLFRLYGGAAACDDRKLRGSAVFGAERTLEQDPLFAFRILVDIAVKALSSAINDPTTAVIVIDQLHRMLRLAGRRRLHNVPALDRQGRLRVVLHRPGWEEFVQLVFREIRHYGADNLQIARRLRAMIENLIQTLPAQRHAALRLELDLLDRSLEKLFDFPEDLALARRGDSQGLGGATKSTA